MSLLPDAVRREAFAEASRFRGEFYACLTTRRDELFELSDAVLCADEAVTSPVDLMLLPEHRRGHGAMYGGLNHGLDVSGNPVGSPRTVEARTPGFANPAPANARTGRQYEFKIDSTTPKTHRYAITRGALPAELTLNPDTGGITGVPKSAGASTFTVVARNNGVADARITYMVTTTP